MKGLKEKMFDLNIVGGLFWFGVGFIGFFFCLFWIFVCLFQREGVSNEVKTLLLNLLKTN